jgi:hypothetical protein
MNPYRAVGLVGSLLAGFFSLLAIRRTFAAWRAFRDPSHAKVVFHVRRRQPILVTLSLDQHLAL